MKDTQKCRSTANLAKRLRSRPFESLKALRKKLFDASPWIGFTAALLSVAWILFVALRPGQGVRLKQTPTSLRARASRVPQVVETARPASGAEIDASVQEFSDGMILRAARAELAARGFDELAAEELFKVTPQISYFWVPTAHVRRYRTKLANAPSRPSHPRRGDRDSTHALTPADDSAPPDIAWYANRAGALQSVPLRDVDPGAYLQWHHFRWPSLLVDRFPLSVDQNFPATRLKRSDEQRYWAAGEPPAPQELPVSACPQHLPLTLHSSHLWGLTARAVPSAPAVIIHDSRPDVRHSDLKGIVTVLETGRDRSDPPDDHGTHVAALISALQDDIGVTGVRPGMPLLSVPLDVVERDGHRLVSLKQVLSGLELIRRLLDRNAFEASSRPLARVVLLNYAFEDRDGAGQGRAAPLREAISTLLAHDIALVVPAGNTVDAQSLQSTQVPASLAPLAVSTKGTLIPVAASDMCSGRAWFSRAAALPSGRVLHAPGERIFSAFVNGDTGYLSGTSLAAALVAGLLGHASQQFPQLTMRQHEQLLERTAQQMPASESDLDAVIDGWEYWHAAHAAALQSQRY